MILLAACTSIVEGRLEHVENAPLRVALPLSASPAALLVVRDLEVRRDLGIWEVPAPGGVTRSEKGLWIDVPVDTADCDRIQIRGSVRVRSAGWTDFIAEGLR